MSRRIERENYQLLLNITTAGHLISFERDGSVLTEVSSSAHHPLPKRRLLLSMPVDKPDEQRTRIRDIEHTCTVQLEGVNPKTFLTIQKQLNKQPQTEGLVHRFEPSGRMAIGAVSYINVQSYQSHVLIRSFHTFPDTCAVMKSESCFRILGDD